MLDNLQVIILDAWCAHFPHPAGRLQINFTILLDSVAWLSIRSFRLPKRNALSLQIIAKIDEHSLSPATHRQKGTHQSQRHVDPLLSRSVAYQLRLTWRPLRLVLRHAEDVCSNGGRLRPRDACRLLVARVRDVAECEDVGRPVEQLEGWLDADVAGRRKQVFGRVGKGEEGPAVGELAGGDDLVGVSKGR